VSAPHRKVMVVPLRMGSEWEVLVLRRGPSKGGLWAPVTGNVDGEESYASAAARELQEETGLGSAAALFPTGFTHTFAKGQGDAAVHFDEEVFAAVVRPGARVRLSHEHVDFKWVTPGEAVALVAFEGCKEGVRRAIAAVEPRAL
jgi:8-oxo-dGTP pyrophosphatase MutT (NUDIX family)